MGAMIEIIEKLYAKLPFATVVVGILLLVLACLMIYSAVGHWRTSFRAGSQRSDDLLKRNLVFEWQRAGDSSTAWFWPSQDADWLKNNSDKPEFIIAYRPSKLIVTLLVSLAGFIVMSIFALSVLPYFGEDFVTGKVLLLILAPCIPALFCAWLAWGAITRLWRKNTGQAAYRLSADFIDVGNRRFTWDELQGIGRVMAPSPGGERLVKLMLWLPDKNTLELDLGALNCPPHQLGMQLERFWQRRKQTDELAYALALSRVAGFLLPLRSRYPIEWEISSTLPAVIRHMAAVGVIVPTLSAGIEFEVDDQPGGCMIALCTDTGEMLEADDPDPLYQRVDLGLIARTLLSRITHALGSTYAQIDGPWLQTQGTHEIKQVPEIVMTTVLAVSGLSLAGVDPASTKPEDRFMFWLCLDARLLDTLNRAEKSRAHDRGEFPTYLEHEIVTAYQTFQTMTQAHTHSNASAPLTR
jgi:hypothetical protein